MHNLYGIFYVIMLFYIIDILNIHLMKFYNILHCSFRNKDKCLFEVDCITEMPPCGKGNLFTK